jgi:carbonic anhydrase
MFKLTVANLLVAVAFIASAQASCMHGTTLMRREEGKIPVATFGYSGEIGPANWAALNPNNTLCRTGSNQAPIVLTDDIPYARSAPSWHIQNVEHAEFENLGSTVEVIVEGVLEFEGKAHKLKQYHFHTPSEHRIRDEYYPLEAHFVHQADDGALLVAAVPFEISEDGTTTALLTNTIVKLDAIAEPGTATETGPLDFTPIIQAVTTGPLFHYQGSLTTPPCAEGVTFLVLEQPLAVDVKTYKALKKVMKFNSRFSQNAPGKENVLEIAKDQAIQEEGGASNGTASNIPVDVNALVQLLVATGKQMRYETVTKTETTVTLVEDDSEVPPVDEPAHEPTETVSVELPTETETTSVELPAETETTSTEAPVETDVHAPGPAEPVPVRRSNLSRRRL